MYRRRPSNCSVPLSFKPSCRRCGLSRQVDYDAIAAAKRTMLDLTYRTFLTEAYSGERTESPTEDGARPPLRTVYPIRGHTA